MSVQEQHGRSSPTISVTESENRFMWSCTKQTQTGPSTEIRQTRYRTHFFGAVSIFVNAACCVLTFRIKEAVHRRGGAWGSVVVKELRYSSDGLGIDSRWCQSLGIFPVATDETICPGADSSSKNEYQGFLLG